MDGWLAPPLNASRDFCMELVPIAGQPGYDPLRSVPEPSVGVLVVIGLVVFGLLVLASKRRQYRVKRLKRGKETPFPSVLRY